jgi:hypothetical protein
MEKQTKFGRVLSRKEQKKIIGGGGASVTCPNGSTLVINCPPGYNAIGNEIDDSVKCCSIATGACYGGRCDGTVFGKPPVSSADA